ncbi:hypothetical protein GCM10017586_11220 [Microbacterium imperiale]|uniref:Uncharacterized protein n=2 Tax=Microbacterium imperiale TaxID=33884 RepID=A0A9W6M2X0_9MICO|nr:hypothetical protein GCM10017586_11220 [Microbacterium imperiale]
MGAGNDPASYNDGMTSPPPPSPGTKPFAAPYVVSPPGRLPEQPARRPSRGVGIAAFLIAAAAAVAGVVVAAVVAARLGTSGAFVRWLDGEGDLSALTPVRGWVLVGEITGWACAVAGATALALGVVAIIRRAGHGLGIGAVGIALGAPVVAVAVASATLFATS